MGSATEFLGVYPDRVYRDLVRVFLVKICPSSAFYSNCFIFNRFDDRQIFGNLLIHDFFNLFELFWIGLTPIRIVKPEPLTGDVAACLGNTFPQYVVERLVQKVSSRMILGRYLALIRESSPKHPGARGLAPFFMFGKNRLKLIL